MRKFEVEVTRVDKFIITIDEDKLDKDLIPEFESFIHKLRGDKIKELAEHIGFNAMDNNNNFYEGIGYIKTDGISEPYKVESGIEIETEYFDEIDVDVTEIK